jgi:hypothetical protein
MSITKALSNERAFVIDIFSTYTPKDSGIGKDTLRGIPDRVE